MERIIELVESLNRDGKDQVIEFLKESNFATARCHKHHNIGEDFLTTPSRYMSL